MFINWAKLAIKRIRSTKMLQYHWQPLGIFWLKKTDRWCPMTSIGSVAQQCNCYYLEIIQGSLTLLLSTRVPFPIKSLALPADVSPRTIHFRVLDESPVSGPGRGLLSCNKWRLWWDSSSLQLTSWPLGVLRGQLVCQWTRPSGCNWDPFVPGLLLMQTIGQSAPIGKEQETLLTSLPFPLSFLFLISSASLRSIPFLSFIVPIFAWNVPLVLLQEGGPLLRPKSGLLSNTQKWIVQGDTYADKARYFIGKGHLDGEQ